TAKGDTVRGDAGRHDGPGAHEEARGVHDIEEEALEVRDRRKERVAHRRVEMSSRLRRKSWPTHTPNPASGIDQSGVNRCARKPSARRVGTDRASDPSAENATRARLASAP